MNLSKDEIMDMIIEMKKQGKSNDEIDMFFLDAFKAKEISMDTYFMIRNIIPQLR